MAPNRSAVRPPVRSFVMARAYDRTRSRSSGSSAGPTTGTYEVDADDPRPPWYVLCMYPYPSGPAHRATSATTPSVTCSFATAPCRATPFSPLRLRLLRPPGRERRHPDRHPPPHLHRRPHRRAQGLGHRASGPSTTGAARSAATIPTYIAGTRSSSSASSRPAWPTGPTPRSTGARAARPSWPTSRSWPTARANAPATWWSSASSSSGSSASPTTSTSCSTDSTTWTGPSGSRPCSATGSAAPKGSSSICGRRDAGDELVLRVFTTRPDTSFGMTYAVVAPEHPLVDVLTTAEHRTEVEDLRARAAGQDRARPHVGARRRGVWPSGGLHRRASSSTRSPARPIPVYVADYVLMRYGTGAIMAVPAEDERDWDFAQAHGLPVVRTDAAPRGVGRSRAGGA